MAPPLYRSDGLLQVHLHCMQQNRTHSQHIKYPYVLNFKSLKAHIFIIIDILHSSETWCFQSFPVNTLPFQLVFNASLHWAIAMCICGSVFNRGEKPRQCADKKSVGWPLGLPAALCCAMLCHAMPAPRAPGAVLQCPCTAPTYRDQPGGLSPTSMLRNRLNGQTHAPIYNPSCEYGIK